MRIGQPRSLQTRQLLVASLFLLAFLALAGYALDRAFLKTARDQLADRLQSYALSLASSGEFARDGAFVAPESMPDSRFARPGSGLYAEVVFPNGHWDSDSAQGPGLPPAPLLPARRTRFEGPLEMREIDGRFGEVYRYGLGLIWSSDDTNKAAEFPYTIYIYEDTDALREQVTVFRAALWRYLGGAGLVLLLLQGVILRWSLLPMRQVIDELKRVQRGEAQRMSERHPRELEPLTDSINAFIQGERENLDRQRNTLADLAHSLKTPLAVMRSKLDDEASDDSSLRSEVRTQVQRMNDIVSYQLARAASRGHALFAQPIPIAPHAEQIVTSLEKVYASKGVLCEFELEEGIQFYGEAGDLQELLGNLLENAFKWAKSRVLLTIEPIACDGGRRPGLLIAVDDDGPGIPPEKVALILQRGVRGDERVQGHGIGLAIVQDLVRAYRGELEVSTSSELGGARFEARMSPGP
ncbi:ATP-binding protein [Cognatilysobacter lacus]|uniref:histidine kinase n=1 Tax=Cognatilysobacter lacus TaxID=1643323 RepID=A0A5D8Z9A4_9GAMM|nr:ATP-binding protein [Lysobacter lacus]TZF91478.1 two-component sensor histidine kinase [Lysobacter lacus]